VAGVVGQGRGGGPFESERCAACAKAVFEGSFGGSQEMRYMIPCSSKKRQPKPKWVTVFQKRRWGAVA
jgi:hypothetical protein